MMANEGKLLRRATHSSIEVMLERREERSILFEALAGTPLLEYRNAEQGGEKISERTL